MGVTSSAHFEIVHPTARMRPNIAGCAVVILCAPTFTIFVFGIALLLLTGNSPGHHDVVSYWTAAHQLLHHANPYDGSAILRPELAAGVPPDFQVLLMRNPPWALALVLPLGMLEVRAASLVWTVLLLGCFIASVQMMGNMLQGRLSKLQTRAHLVGYTFAPALLCILTGQSSLFALHGLVLFLRFHRARPYLAGSGLYLCALKPHLFLPVAVALFTWIVASQAWRLLAGFLATLSLMTAIAMSFDPLIWSHYLDMMRTSGIAAEFIACPAVALRFLIAPDAMWVQYLLPGLGCAWAGIYYWKNRARWDWMENGALLVLVSIVVSPYAWITDQAVLLPVLMLGSLRTVGAWPLRTLMLASALIEIQQLCGVTMHSPCVLWSAPFFVAWFLIVSRRRDTRALLIEQRAVPTPRTAHQASLKLLAHTSESGAPTAAP